MSCLACLSDQSCGWCPSVSRCLMRDGPDLEPCPERETGEGQGEKGQGMEEDQRHLLLAPQHCTLCEEYRDCSACTQVTHQVLTLSITMLLIICSLIWRNFIPDLCKDNFLLQDPYCEWQINSNKKGDYQCSRRGRLDGSIRDSRGCPKVCNQ